MPTPSPSPTPKPSTSGSSKGGSSAKPKPTPSPSPGPKPTPSKTKKTTNTAGKRDLGRRSSSQISYDYVKLKRPPINEYKWNLPPHQWSLPTKPSAYNDEVTVLGGEGGMEQYRRGRIWWYASVDSAMFDASKNDPRTGIASQQFGFQFTWNPESYSTGVSLNTDTTPNVNDRFVGVAGAFPSGETISFNLRLDRTNDFAAARHLLTKNYAAIPTFNKIGQGIYVPSETTPETFAPLSGYYTTGLGNGTKEEINEKIKELLQLGTVADLEYLYKAVNGNGWKNAAGRPTSDIGYLAATLLRVDIGPMSYIGYILSLNVNHIGFSQDMTPIRTDVTISMNLMASAGQTIPDKKKD